jgi:hypothetical protein
MKDNGLAAVMGEPDFFVAALFSDPMGRGVVRMDDAYGVLRGKMLVAPGNCSQYGLCGIAKPMEARSQHPAEFRGSLE